MLIQQDKFTGNNWKIGQMIKLNKGRDNFVSAANIEDIKNNEKVIITRPVNKRNPVELAYTKAEIKLEFVYDKTFLLFKTFSVNEGTRGSLSGHSPLISFSIYFRIFIIGIQSSFSSERLGLSFSLLQQIDHGDEMND